MIFNKHFDDCQPNPSKFRAQSSSSDEADFERISSNAFSVDNFNSNHSKKGIVKIQKNKVNFF